MFLLYIKFIFFLQNNQFLKNLFLVLSYGSPDSTGFLNETTFANSTASFLDIFNATETTPENISLGVCGANFCKAETASPNLKPPPASRINLISAIYLGCMAVACLIVALGVDTVKR